MVGFKFPQTGAEEVAVQPDADDTKKTRNRLSRRCGDVDLDKLERKFLNVLKRESNRLLDESFEAQLSADSSKTLCNYLKLLKEFKQQELDFLEKMPLDELEEAAGKPKN